jgi:hypothetical protein
MVENAHFMDENTNKSQFSVGIIALSKAKRINENVHNA